MLSRSPREFWFYAFEQARGGSGVWYAMELTKLLLHVAGGLTIDWD